MQPGQSKSIQPCGGAQVRDVSSSANTCAITEAQTSLVAQLNVISSIANDCAVVLTKPGHSWHSNAEICLPHANEFSIKTEALIIGDVAITNVKTSALSKDCDIHTVNSNSLKDLQKAIREKKPYKKYIVSYSRFGDNIINELEELAKTIRSKNSSASIDITDMLPYKSEHTKWQFEDACKEFKISMIRMPFINSDRERYLRYMSSHNKFILNETGTANFLLAIAERYPWLVNTVKKSTLNLNESRAKNQPQMVNLQNSINISATSPQNNNSCQPKYVVSKARLTAPQSSMTDTYSAERDRETKISYKEINNSMENVLQTNNLQRSDVAGDGHCLLHAIVKCYNHDTPVEKRISLNWIKEEIISHISRNKARYLSYITREKYQREMTEEEILILTIKEYIQEKRYNQDITDLIPNIAAEIVNANITIYNVRNIKQVGRISISPPEIDRRTKSIALLRENEHYSSLVPKVSLSTPHAEIHTSTASKQKESAKISAHLLTFEEKSKMLSLQYMKYHKHDTSTKMSCISKSTLKAKNAITSTQIEETSLSFDSNKDELAKNKNANNWQRINSNRTRATQVNRHEEIETPLHNSYSILQDDSLPEKSSQEINNFLGQIRKNVSNNR